MKRKMMKRNVMHTAGVAAMAAAGLSATTEGFAANGYQAGDFHNHTTCTDGSTSTKTLAKKSLTYLDWFIDAGHSGSGNRDCRLDDFAYDGPADGQGNYWVNTIGAAAIEGDVVTSTSNGAPAGTRAMWRWQSLLQFVLRDIRREGFAAGKPAFLGLEWTVPGHEHASTSVITGQYNANGGPPVSAEMARFEYCFGRPSDDTSQGGGRGWTCEISAANNDKLISRFTGDPVDPDYNGSIPAGMGVKTADNGDHVKSTATVYWRQETNPGRSYAVPAHIERAGAFESTQDRGYNIEHIRDWNNAGPDVSFGFESQPGHQASPRRGEYDPSRPSVGLTTFGGTGCYSAAEASQPGRNFDGTPLTAGDFLETGAFPEVPDDMTPARVTVCRPGVRTVWDALLSEGRRYFFFASSDWHNRGQFAPFDAERRSTLDFFPGEYQKNYTFIHTANRANPAQDIVDGLRSGNNFATMGDLIDRARFHACVRTGVGTQRCATMGQTLEVNPGDNVVVRISVRDPSGRNNSPCSFNNPALRQLGIRQPLNKPSLAQVDVITGVVTGLVDPATDPVGYRAQQAPATTVLARSWTPADWGTGIWKSMTHTIPAVAQDMYVRARGSNLPAGTPNERDANGNPLRDDLANNILCQEAGCPLHVNGVFDMDVEGWGDLWFYLNPIFIDVQEPALQANAGNP